MISFVFIAAALLLVLYGIYLHISTLRWDESELRELDQIELHLAHILRMLEAPDVRALLDQPKAREDLLIEFSACLKDDVLQLLKIGGLRLSSLLLVGLFFLQLHGKMANYRQYLQLAKQQVFFKVISFQHEFFYTCHS